MSESFFKFYIAYSKWKRYPERRSTPISLIVKVQNCCFKTIRFCTFITKVNAVLWRLTFV